ncbi:hypothetical protein [Streptomyces sp. NPDC057682]|uniref:hypothetical protein n=1 Tax=Streptomyces sp. NPDC057682 TaxID=3346210 RepID=UPI0036C1BC61
MAPAHLAARPARCVACLTLTAAATLGGVMAGEPHADARASGRGGASAEPPSGTPYAPPPVAHVPTPVPSASGLPSTAAPPSATGLPSASAPVPVPSATASVPAAPGAPAPAASWGAPAHPAPPPSATDSSSPDPGSPRPEDVQSPMAGLPAGEGRPRPGRTLSPQELDGADRLDDSENEPEPTPPAASPGTTATAGIGRPSHQALSGPAVKRVQQMSLGVGIALVGMGLGFLALRMRRSG